MSETSEPLTEYHLLQAMLLTGAVVYAASTAVPVGTYYILTPGPDSPFEKIVFMAKSEEPAFVERMAAMGASTIPLRRWVAAEREYKQIIARETEENGTSLE